MVFWGREARKALARKELSSFRAACATHMKVEQINEVTKRLQDEAYPKTLKEKQATWKANRMALGNKMKGGRIA